MKKTIAILLVAILAVSSVFAAFSGEAKVGFGGNLDNGNFGFIDQSANVKFDVDLATATAEQIADGDVYASIKATFGLKVTTGEKKYGGDDPFFSWENGTNNGLTLAVIADITEAKVAGENWYVSILGVPDAPNFAESAIDTYTVEDGWDKYGMSRADYDKAYNYGIPFEKATGVEVSVFDYVFGLGLVGDYNDDDAWKFEDYLDLALYAKTPEFEVIDGLTIQAGATYATVDANYEGAEKDVNAFGASAKVAYASDLLSASVATDMGYDIEVEKFGTDVAANLGFDFVTVDAYYATDVTVDGTDIEDLLSLQAKLDLTGFNVPVGLTLKGKDLVNAQDLSATVDLTFGSFKVSPTVGYVVDTEIFKAGVAAEYVCDYFTAKAETNIKTAFEKDDLVWDASASIENTTLIPGATIKLAWSDAKDLLNNDATAENEYGKIVASLKVEF